MHVRPEVRDRRRSAIQVGLARGRVHEEDLVEDRPQALMAVQRRTHRGMGGHRDGNPDIYYWAPPLCPP